MATSTLEVIIRGKDLLTPTIQKASASLNGLRSSADGLKNSILAGVGLGAGIGAFGLMTTAVSKMSDALVDSVRLAIEDEASVRRLTQTLQENAPAWNGSMAAIERFTKAGQELAFTDDAIRESIGKLTVSTGSVSRAMELTRTAMDLARLKNIDLATASDYVNKAVGGQIGALRRVLPFLSSTATATQALAAIQQAAAGQANAYAATVEGRVTAAQIALDEALENLGRVAMPLVADGATNLTNVLTLLTGATDGLTVSTTTAQGAVQGFGYTTTTQFNDLATALANVWKVISFSPIPGLISLLTDLTTVTIDQQDADKAAAVALAQSAAAMDGASRAASDYAGYLHEAGDAARYAADHTLTAAEAYAELAYTMSYTTNAQTGFRITTEQARQALIDATNAHQAFLASQDKVKTATHTTTVAIHGETEAIKEDAAAVIEWVSAVTAADKALAAFKGKHMGPQKTGGNPTYKPIIGANQPVAVEGPYGSTRYKIDKGSGGGGSQRVLIAPGQTGTAPPAGGSGAGGTYSGGNGTPIQFIVDGKVLWEVIDPYVARLA